MKADLHIHTSLSDGTCLPEEIVNAARQGGLDLIAITDHDTFSGFRAAAQVDQSDVKIIAGIEFSTFFNGDEVHILGYFPGDVPENVEAFALKSQQYRQERVRECLKNLEKENVRVAFHEVEKLVKGDVFTRNHIANSLLKRRIVSSIGFAFEKYLNYSRGIVPHLPVKAEQAIEVIHEGGGKAVWAHPDFDVFDSQVETLVSMGLDGVEVSRKKSEGVYTYYLERVAEDFELIRTGGSDFHGYERNFSLGDYYVDGKKIRRFLEALKIEEQS